MHNVHAIVIAYFSLFFCFSCLLRMQCAAIVLGRRNPIFMAWKIWDWAQQQFYLFMVCYCSWFSLLYFWLLSGLCFLPFDYPTKVRYSQSYVFGESVFWSNWENAQVKLFDGVQILVRFRFKANNFTKTGLLCACFPGNI